MKLPQMFENSNNPIVLSGDEHDSYAFTLYDSGFEEGDPVGVNLVTPGVTSVGYNEQYFQILGSTVGALGGIEGYRKMLRDGLIHNHRGMVYGDVVYRGFIAAEVTRTQHVAEYFHFADETMASNYSEARAASGMIVADFICGSSVVTDANVKGSLEEQESCGAITFETARPAAWDLPVPIDSVPPPGDAVSTCGMFPCLVDASSLVEGVSPSPTNPSTPTLRPEGDGDGAGGVGGKKMGMGKTMGMMKGGSRRLSSHEKPRVAAVRGDQK